MGRLFDVSGFPPRWTCGSGWSEAPWLGWLHILSDLGVWSAYLAIPLVLAFFLLRRQDLPFRKVFLLFGAFIFACGTTHLMEAIIFWWPAYRLAGVIKLFTAIISWATVFALFRVMPGVLTMRSPEELEREIAARTLAERELQQANADLDLRVQQRTADLTLAADALRDERELLRTTLKSIGDGVVVTDTEGRITFLNGSAEQLTGWSTAEARGQPLEIVYQIVNEQSRLPIENRALQVLKEEAPSGMANQSLLLSRRGTELPIDESAAAIRGEVGAARGAVLVFRDATERKKSEQILKDTDRRKDEFLATIAHELRNPLAPIRNSLEVMKRSDGNAQLIEQSRITMERQLGQLIRLVDDLIDASRITQNKLELRRERINIASIIDHAVEASRPLIDRSKQILSVSLPSEPIYLNADSVRLTQVFNNLLTNACKYTEFGGRIWLTVTRMGDDVVTTVRDTGIGIPPDMLDQIFELFTQVDRSLERTQSGLGIGLTVVKRLVEMHDGTVTAVSAGRGQGSEFIVRIPAAPSQQVSHQEEVKEQKMPATPSKKRVLVVDDNRDSAISMGMMLKIMGYETQTAFDGEAAISAAEEFQPEVILLDIGMPKMNGYDACRHIRSRPWASETVIIAQTGWGQPEDRRRSEEAGFDHHVVKPLDPVLLQSLLATTRTGTRSGDSSADLT